MKPILEKLLRKRGIETTNELDNEELKVFEDWQKILSKDKLTIGDVKEFCESQLQVIEMRWKDYSVENSKKAELIPYHTVYKTLLQAIDSPQSMRENLENQLIEMTK